MHRILAVFALIVLMHHAAHAAAITSALEVDGMAGQPLSYQITADNAPTAYSTSGLGSITGLALNKKTGAISGTPTTSGTFNVTVSATGKSGTVSKRVVFTIVKTPVGIISADSTSGAVNIAFTFQLSAPVTTPTYSATGLPPGLKVSSSSGKITGTPTTGGVYAPIVTITNKTTIATGILSIIINGGVAAPSSIALTPLSGTVGVPYTGAFTAKGATPITFTFSSALPPGVMTTNANLISGTPTIAGVTPLTVTASNAFGSTTVTLNFSIAPPNGSPLISSPLAVSGEVGENFLYKFTAAGKTPLSFSVDATKLPRGLAQDDSGNITGYPFDPGTFSVPVSAANTVGSDNQNLVITIATLAPGDATASIKFTDGYRDVKQLSEKVATGGFNFTATINTPAIDPSKFISSLTVDVTVGLYEFSGALGDASTSGKFTPGKSAAFNFTAAKNGKMVRIGGISFMLLRTGQIKIIGRRKGTDTLGGVQTIHAEQLTGLNQQINETIPVKIQIGDTILASFYVPCTGSASVKTVKNPPGTGTLQLSTVKLKGAGLGSPSN